jgi:CheY-like chemotaxis protein
MQEPYKILVIDDEPFIRSLFETVLTEEECTVASYGSSREGIEAACQSTFDVVITDIMMPELTGIDVLRSVKKHSPDTGVIMITGYASLETAMEALHLGADEYLQKPFQDFTGQVVPTIKKTAQRYQLANENRRLVAELDETNNRLKKTNVEFRKMLARVSTIQQTSQLLSACADLDTILDLFEDGLRSFDIESYAIMLNDGEGKMRVTRQMNIANSDNFVISNDSTGTIAQTAYSQSPGVISEFKNDPDYERAPIVDNDDDVDSIVVLPMAAAAEAVGAIVACGFGEDSLFDDELVNSLSVFTSTIAAPLALMKKNITGSGQ